MASYPNSRDAYKTQAKKPNISTISRSSGYYSGPVTILDTILISVTFPLPTP